MERRPGIAIVSGLAPFLVASTLGSSQRKREGEAGRDIAKDHMITQEADSIGDAAPTGQSNVREPDHDSPDDRKSQSVIENASTSCFSRTSSEGSFDVPLQKKEVIAKPITWRDLEELGSGRESSMYKTVFAVASELWNLKCGGAMVMIYESPRHRNEGSLALPISDLGGGGLMKVMKRHVKTLFVNGSVNPNFRAVLDAFASVDREGIAAGKWTKPVLECMAEAFNTSWDAAEEVRALLDEPADGAVAILSLRGTVVAASSMINIEPTIVMRRPDGKGTGMKHTAAASAVEWCRSNGLRGAAVVRSNAELVTVLCILDGEVLAFQITG